tara:strand:+ start:130 stop:669 length:540 start_codon:yes stop_codon:yes gene_type:complete
MSALIKGIIKSSTDAAVKAAAKAAKSVVKKGDGLSKESQVKARNLYQGLKNERVPANFKKRIEAVKRAEQDIYQERRQIRQMKRDPEKIAKRKDNLQNMENTFSKKVDDLGNLFDNYIIGKPQSGKFYPEGAPRKAKPKKSASKKPTPKKTGGRITYRAGGGMIGNNGIMYGYKKGGQV